MLIKIESSYSRVMSVTDSKTNNTLSIPNCGQLVGAGSTAEVFEDLDAPSFLFKKYDLIGNSYDDVLDMAIKESENFNAYYGNDASNIIQYGGDIYLHMIRVPGIPLNALYTEDIPENLEELYLQLICKLNDIGIIHADLNISNLLYDKETNTLFPIDFRNIYYEYYSSSQEEKEHFDKKLQMRSNNFYSLLDRLK
ncbi:protein kinase [Escherichia albertii]|nr:protein kinase [Escherichia albertii]